MSETKIISYFSYKGGAGRSTLAFNTIPLLAQEHMRPTKDAPIIIIDMDIDSCGMSYLLGVEDEVTDENCVQYLLENGCSEEKTTRIYDHPAFRNLCPVGEKFGYYDNDAILFMPAKDIKNIDEKKKFYYNDSDNPFESRLLSFIKICKKHNIPAVILDSAVGNTSIANASNRLADIIVCCMRPTTQFVNGTVRYLKSLDSNENSPLNGGHKEIVIVPNVVPQEEMIIDNQRYPFMAISRILDKIQPIIEGRDEFDDIVYDTTMLSSLEFGIPAVKSFMWREGQLYTQENLDENEKIVLGRYEKLAGVIAKRCE